MLLLEEERGYRFDMVLTHDAEDLIDPDALRWINYYGQEHDMVQIPVLALPTPFREISHGVYCDEFAEFQFKDMIARQTLGGFIPSNGVGTGFSRRALEAMAAESSNRIFEPGCLTEDYENGFRVARMGLKQKFIPVRFRYGRPIATREYFPRDFHSAVKQRSRWITGINLQSWSFHGWRETLRHGYWFWRDRKGLIGNLLTPLTNVLFLYGLATLAIAEAKGRRWGLAREAASLAWLCAGGLALQAFHVTIRARCSCRVYGWKHALGVPLRVVAANWINCFATCRAIWTFGSAKIAGRPLRWVKTEHAYPNRAALMTERRRLGEILVSNQWLSAEELEEALASKPENCRLGEHLIRLGRLTEQELYAALSLQTQLPFGKPEPDTIMRSITRVLPGSFVRKWRVLPFRVAAGELYIAGSDPPGEELQNEIRRFSSLEVRFHLVTPTEYQELADEYLDPVQA
jgi:adsorption protein B